MFRGASPVSAFFTPTRSILRIPSESVTIVFLGVNVRVLVPEDGCQERLPYSFAEISVLVLTVFVVEKVHPHDLIAIFDNLLHVYNSK
jgi:hypothetical protein